MYKEFFQKIENKRFLNSFVLKPINRFKIKRYNSERKRILKNLIYGEKILIIGTDYSAKDLKKIPKDCLIFTCNYGLKLLLEKNLTRNVDLFLCSKYALSIRKDLGEIIKKTKIRFFITDDLRNIRKKNIFNGKLIYDSFKGNYYLEKLIAPIKVKEITGDSSFYWTSSLIRLLQYALYFNAKEIYLAGVDLDEKDDFFGEKYVPDHRIIDNNFMKIVSKKSENLHKNFFKSF